MNGGHTVLIDGGSRCLTGIKLEQTVDEAITVETTTRTIIECTPYLNGGCSNTLDSTESGSGGFRAVAEPEEMWDSLIVT